MALTKATTDVIQSVANTAITGNIESSQIADSSVTTAKLADSNVTTAKLADGSVTPAKGGTGQNFSTTAQGSTLYFSATGSVAALAPGTSGQFLKTQGAGANPTWDTVTATAPVFSRVVRTAGHITTTSTSLVDLTGATVTFTTGAFPVAYGVVQSVELDVSDSPTFNIQIDGSNELGTAGLQARGPAVNQPQNMSFTGQSAALSAASHTVKLVWRVGSGTGLTYANAPNSHLFWAHEIR